MSSVLALEWDLGYCDKMLVTYRKLLRFLKRFRGNHFKKYC